MSEIFQSSDEKDWARASGTALSVKQVNTNNQGMASSSDSTTSSLAGPSRADTTANSTDPAMQASGGPVIQPTQNNGSAVPDGMPMNADVSASAPGLLTASSTESLELPAVPHLKSVHPAPQLHSGGAMPDNDSSAMDLGSLSSFMETRGINNVECRPASSCSVTRPADVNQSASDLPLPGPSSALMGVRESSTSPPLESQSSVQATDDPPEELVMFISSALLRSHLSLVRFLGEQPDTVKLIYRDPKGLRWDGSIVTFPDVPSSEIPARLLPDEADIIITPNAGIMLTTTQALTQAYLPGQSASFSSHPAYLQSNGPVRTRIIDLSRRYVFLYVLISCSNTGSGDSAFDVDKSTAEAIEGLTTFCQGLSSTTTIIPLFVPSDEELANMVLTLARKHVSQLPAIKGHRIGEGYGPDLHFCDIIQGQQSSWELFLRINGLNPFAARAILDILRTRGRLATQQAALLHIPFIDDRSFALHDFLAMSYDERVAEFQELVGEAILQDVQIALDRDLE